MAINIARRKFIATFSGAAFAWPVRRRMAVSQQTTFRAYPGRFSAITAAPADCRSRGEICHV